MFKLLPTDQFYRRAEKFKKSHPDLKKKLAQTLRDLEKDPFQPHLKLHALRGKLEGLHAVSITYHYRITLILRITKKAIILLDIGTHDEVYRK